ncbi:serine/threonine-protein kinase [Streptomyces sp. NPDC093595]|uniref:serine/threonine-protein kinase n=1 Tax=Streptomyces sp. NPDC093595 TaxID=3366045 RepID=UPI003818F983
MGKVWRAHDEVLHRTVAVKELTAGKYVSEADRIVLHARTQKEARAAARISHPGVVTVHDVLDHDARPWIVMQYVDGPSLADAAKEAENRRIDAREAARIGLHVLGALRAAHAAGVLHRDVKPGNVLLARDGRVLLTDFGIAAIEGDSTITRTGELVGSIDYLAPERVRGGRPGPASDLWSLGATLYAAVEGTSPFRRSSPISTMQAVVTEEPEPARYAGALAPVITALLRKDPADRPEAAEAERMLLEAMEGRTPTAAQAYVPTQRVDAADRTAATKVLEDTGVPTRRDSVATGPRTGTAETGAGAGGGEASAADGAEASGPGGTGGTGSAGGTGEGAAAGAGNASGGDARGPSGSGPAAARGSSGGIPAPGAGPDDTPAPGASPAPGTVPGATAAGKDAGGVPRWRMAALVVALAAVVGSAAGFVVTLYGGDGTPAGDPSGRTATGDPSVATSVPDGWERVKDPEGFSLFVPRGWKRRLDGNQIDYTPDNGRHRIRISKDPAPDFETPCLHMLDIEKGLRKRLPQYARKQLRTNTFRDQLESCLWEFTWVEKKDHPGKRHAIDQVYYTDDGTEYALYMSSPAEDWATTRKQFDTVLRGWRPAEE